MQLVNSTNTCSIDTAKPPGHRFMQKFLIVISVKIQDIVVIPTVNFLSNNFIIILANIEHCGLVVTWEAAN